VSFVYLHAGTPFAKKGDLDMALPRMDVPAGVVHWEMFVPDRYSTRVTGGNAIDLGAVPEARIAGVPGSLGGGLVIGGRTDLKSTVPIPGELGELRGMARDSAGAVLRGVTVEVASTSLPEGMRTAVTDAGGTYRMNGLPAGTYSITFRLLGFNTARRDAVGVGTGQSTTVNAELPLGALEETITVFGESPDDRDQRRAERQQLVMPSTNVVNLQRRTAGVLPIRLDVPRAGTSLQFVKPLVVDQEVNVTLRYKRRG
jgi:hypothetical protein